MQRFLREAKKLGFDGYCCFKVGEEGTASGKWAYKKDSIDGYSPKNGETHRGYVTALYPELNALNFKSPTKHCKKVNAKKCKLLWKYSKIYWLYNVA